MSTRSLNKVLLIGNLTKDPNLRFTPNGTAVCSFVVATNREWVAAEGGEKQSHVEYTTVVVWAKLADVAGKILHKGAKVYIEGRLQSREWKKEDGTTTRIFEVIGENMILLKSAAGYQGPSGDDTASGTAPAPKTSQSTASSYSDDSISDAQDIADDIPF